MQKRFSGAEYRGRNSPMIFGYASQEIALKVASSTLTRPPLAQKVIDGPTVNRAP